MKCSPPLNPSSTTTNSVLTGNHKMSWLYSSGSQTFLFISRTPITLRVYKWNQMDPCCTCPFGSICTLSELQTRKGSYGTPSKEPEGPWMQLWEPLLYFNAWLLPRGQSLVKKCNAWMWHARCPPPSTPVNWWVIPLERRRPCQFKYFLSLNICNVILLVLYCFVLFMFFHVCFMNIFTGVFCWLISLNVLFCHLLDLLKTVQ